MKTVWVLGVLALTGCTIERTVVEPAPSTAIASTTTSTTEPIAVPIYDADEAFLSDLREEAPASRNLPDSTLLDTARITCGAFSSGVTLEEVSGLILANSNDYETKDMLQWLTVFAVIHFCPEHESVMTESGY